jgi:hypothetical protein
VQEPEEVSVCQRSNEEYASAMGTMYALLRDFVKHTRTHILNGTAKKKD